jgi:phosphatidylglycerophosphate synthase
MFREGLAIYRATQKKHDQLWNRFVMRPVAGVVVALIAPTRVTPNQITLLNLGIFVVAAAILALVPTYAGGLAAVAVLELSYLFDCVDGMLARHKKLASKAGHLFDFYVDQVKAIVLVASLGAHLAQRGAIGLDGTTWTGAPVLGAAVVGVALIALATSLTEFVRRPEVSGEETTVEAYYEKERGPERPSTLALIAGQLFTFLRFLNHYPSHIVLFAALGRLDAFFWMYLGLNALYLARGWLGLVVRFGRFDAR